MEKDLANTYAIMDKRSTEPCTYNSPVNVQSRSEGKDLSVLHILFIDSDADRYPHHIGQNKLIMGEFICDNCGGARALSRF